jgi:hypothetical protein
VLHTTGIYYAANENTFLENAVFGFSATIDAPAPLATVTLTSDSNEIPWLHDDARLGDACALKSRDSTCPKHMIREKQKNPATATRAATATECSWPHSLSSHLPGECDLHRVDWRKLEALQRVLGHA